MNTDKLNEIGFADWNKKSLNELVQHLEREFCYQSTGTAKAIFTLIEYYHKTKQLNKPLVMQGLPTEEEIRAQALLMENPNDGYATKIIARAAYESGARWAISNMSGSPTVGKAGGGFKDKKPSTKRKLEH